MGFFDKLKERLFTLNVEEDKPKKEKVQKSNDKDKKLSKEIERVDSKQNKAFKKKLKKEKKINKYVAGLSKSGFSFSQKLKEIQSRYNEVDDEFLEELEEVLIMSDISVNLVQEIIEEIRKTLKIENVKDPGEVSEIIADKLFTIYTNRSAVDTTLNIEDGRTNVILVVGVNGAGKTTTIAKLANSFKNEGKKVLIAAADTFRAGAVEQLSVWAERIGVDIVKSKKPNADPASVVYDAVEKSKNDSYDILIVDTAGRLQNKINLMKELEKMNRILSKSISGAPHESLLVLDATTGQNGLSQATNFKDVTPLTGIVLTKMDGTSKGGIVLSIKDKLKLAVKYIGLGEKLEDLQEFDLDAFIYGMTKDLMEDE